MTKIILIRFSNSSLGVSSLFFLNLADVKPDSGIGLTRSFESFATLKPKNTKKFDRQLKNNLSDCDSLDYTTKPLYRQDVTNSLKEFSSSMSFIKLKRPSNSKWAKVKQLFKRKKTRGEKRLLKKLSSTSRTSVARRRLFR